MNRRKLALFLVLTFVFTAIWHGESRASETETKTLLRMDLVIERDGKYVQDQTDECRIQLPATHGEGRLEPFHIRRHVEAPSDLMSRDNFISIVTRFLVTHRVALASILVPDLSTMDALTAIRCAVVRKPPIEVDFVVNLVMDERGIKVEVLDTSSGERSLDEKSWDEILSL